MRGLRSNSKFGAKAPGGSIFVPRLNCKVVAALVVLGTQKDAVESVHKFASPHNQETSICLEHDRKKIIEIPTMQD